MMDNRIFRVKRDNGVGGDSEAAACRSAATEASFPTVHSFHLFDGPNCWGEA